jgi:hypothetical protein
VSLLTSLDCPTDRLSRRGAAVENLSHSASLHAASVVPPHSGTKHLGRPQALGRSDINLDFAGVDLDGSGGFGECK